MPLPPSRFDSTMPPRPARKPTSRLKSPKTSPTAEPRLSRTRRPANLQVADWQTVLRRQFGREQRFGLENLGSHPVFSDFRRVQPGERYAVPRGDPRPRTWAEFLHLSGFRDQSPGHLQAHRVHARQAGSEARRQGCIGARLRSDVQRDLARLHGRASAALPGRNGLPFRRAGAGEVAVRSRRRLGAAAGEATRTGAPAVRCPRVRPRAAMPRRRLAVHRPDP